MSIFKDNYFTNDTYSLRTERLKIIKNYILDWSGHLSIPQEIIDWGMTALNRWQNILKRVEEKKSHTSNIFLELKEIDEITFNYYLKCKRLIKNKYSSNLKVSHSLGIDVKFPRNRNDKINAVKKMLKAFSRQKEQNEPALLPEDFVLKLESYLERSVEIYEKVHMKSSSTSAESVERQIEIFKEDSKKLRTLYSWALMTWEADEPYLFQLGFAVKPKRKIEDEVDEEHE